MRVPVKLGHRFLFKAIIGGDRSRIWYSALVAGERCNVVKSQSTQGPAGESVFAKSTGEGPGSRPYNIGGRWPRNMVIVPSYLTIDMVFDC